MSRARRTVRLRLTLLYGGLFLLSGTCVVATTYVLVDRAAQDDPVSITLPDGAVVSLNGLSPTPSAAPAQAGSQRTDATDGPAPADRVMPDDAEVRAIAERQHTARMNELLVQSGVALAGTAVLSVVLGWLVAGRVLRPLRTITARTRDISATNLHERLAVGGPGDELTELGETIDDLLGRLERAFEAQRQFVANASHELRTPLARQRTLAQVALDDPEPTVESLRAAHERVLAAGAQQERLIEALLTLARGQTGAGRIEPFDLADVAARVVGSAHLEAGRRSVEVRSELDRAPVAGDVRLVERLVVNLVDNAVRHNVEGGQVTVTTGTRDGRAVLAVVNTGPVVAETDVERLFEPFQRAAPGRTAHDGGLGLGLSIVRAVSGAHGAGLAARPCPGGGLHVDVTFPSAYIGSTSSQKSSSPRSVTARPPATAPPERRSDRQS